MVEAVLSFALGKLGSFITQNLPLPGDLGSDMEWLLEELEYIKHSLKDAEKKQVDDELVSKWLSDITKISNDIVYVLEDFEFSMGQTGTSKTYLDRVRYYAGIRTKEIDVFDICAKVISLKRRVEEISGKSVTYGITTNARERKYLRSSILYTYANPPVVGFEEVKLNVMGDLLNEDPHRCMVLIYGEGGSGKFSLVKSLYSTKEVLSSFNRHTWKHVDQDYSVLDVLRNVARSLKDVYTDEEALILHYGHVELLESYLRIALGVEGNKYLLLIDGVCDIEVWESLERVFTVDHHNSRVIVTTRNKDLAVRMSERVYVHHLQPLNQTDSWELFLENLHKGDSKGANWFSKAMQEMGREMINKCDGFPLSIVLLAGMLAHKKTLQEWQIMSQHVWSHSIDGPVEISYLLDLSYDDLPSELKLCFLYVGVYPEYFEIQAKMLLKCWIAEGFIKPGEKGEEMEDIAQSYLRELINRNLIQVSSVTSFEIDLCRIHDLIRNLAVKKAMEVDFLDIYNPFGAQPSLVRRQVIHADIQRYVYAPDHENTECLRSLIVFNPSKIQLISANVVATLRKFSRLSVLYIELVETPQKLLKVIGTWKQLRLLMLGTVTSTKIYLPSSIGDLRQLQTILITSGVCYLPGKISELKNLRHLLCPRGFEGHTTEIWTLSNLQTLDAIRYEHWNCIQTKNLINLRELSIVDIKVQNRKPYSLESISKLKSLQNLTLACSRDNEMGFPVMDFMFSLPKICKVFLFGKLRMLSLVEKWLHSISVLCLRFSLLEEDPIPMLASLTNLICLELVETHESLVMFFPPQSFPQLEQIGLYGLSKLKVLELGEGALPIIKTLYITRCPELKEDNMPEKLNSILVHGPGW